MERKACPYCDMAIPKETSICPYCGKPVGVMDMITKNVCLIVFLISLVIIAIGMWMKS